jgi:hypothetical protein
VKVINHLGDEVMKVSGSLLLCYVDHHDEAYQWAERRKLETHPKTGAAQLVEDSGARSRDPNSEVRGNRV